MTSKVESLIGGRDGLDGGQYRIDLVLMGSQMMKVHLVMESQVVKANRSGVWTV